MHKYFKVHTAYDLASGAVDEALTVTFLRTLGNNGAWGPFVVLVSARHCDHPLAEPAALFKGGQSPAEAASADVGRHRRPRRR